MMKLTLKIYSQKHFLMHAIKNIRNIVSTVSKKRDFEVTEKIIQETKNQAKLNDDDNPRKALIFSS